MPFARQAEARDIRRSVQRQRHAQRVLQPNVITLPSPTGGLNGRDALDSMKPDDAVQLINFVPGFGKVEVRPGSALWATVGSAGFTPATGAVETLAELKMSTGLRLIAAADGKIYDVATTGEKDTELGSGFAHDRWQYAVMNDQLGLVNGQDAPQVYDGTTLAAMTISGTALTVSTLIGITVHKSRSWFIPVNSQDVWYSAVNALGGALTKFPLSDVGSSGGHLVAMIAWSRDGGAGMDDLAVFVMSSGEAIIYAGSDPGDANDWSKIGIYDFGTPISRRGVIKLGGDALILTSDGATLLSQVIPGARGASGITVTDKLGKFLLDQIKSTGAEFGWQAIHYPRGRRLLINYPIGGAHQQFAANLATGAWTQFQSMNASCWSLFGDRLFFGGPGGLVVEADTGVSDQGADIVAKGQLAFSPLRGPVGNRHVQMVRGLFEAAGTIDVDISLFADYSPVPEATVQATFGTVGEAGGEWGVAEWGVDFWAGPSKVAQNWVGHAARGYTISPAVSVAQNNNRVAWSGMMLSYVVEGLV
ncbi:MAG TPA: hypothetical protein VMW68_08495 [Methyloceanibacter sp.]|nr:hypothetical protein [Methyloceanibacter sp.]